MSGLVLKLRQPPAMRLDLHGIVPAKIAGLSNGAIEDLSIATETGHGRLGDFFTVSGASGEHITIEGSTDRLDFIGNDMDGGRIIVAGDAGAYVGAGMRNGRIEVAGNAGSYLASGVRGGIISVGGSAGDFVGGARSGERFGMQGGIVVVAGNIGTRAGERMRRGTIIAKGTFGPAAGSRMVGGTLWTERGFGAGPGPLLRRGSLIGPAVEALLPTYADCGRHDLVILRVLSRQIAAMLGPLAPAPLPPSVRRLAGDMAAIGKGEILLTA